MDTKFSAYNLHRIVPDQFSKLDSHLRLLNDQPFVYKSPLINCIPRSIPGIYTLGGGRQIGKSTLLKQWIAELLEEGVPPSSIMFYTGELIDNQHMLVELLQDYIAESAPNQLNYIIIDEITYIEKWDKGIKFLADAGIFRKCVVVLTGSDLTMMQAARMTFPGRRGKADQVDFHMYSLSFRETLQLKNTVPELEEIIAEERAVDEGMLEKIYDEFQLYLKHGGYLTAINDFALTKSISKYTLKTYSDWIRGDILKRQRQESYLREIISNIINSYNKQLSWNAIADHVSIDSPKTVADYCELLEMIDALFIQKAIMLDKLVGAPKKARKLTFTDPFIFHAMRYWLSSSASDPQITIDADINNPLLCAELVEGVVSNHYRRYYPTYYIKAKGEIDIAYVDQNTCWPVEIKWCNQLRLHELKELKKYPNTKVLSKQYSFGKVNGIVVEPLPLALLKIGV
jgi:predicted AAA+ superfamily ATPase